MPIAERVRLSLELPPGSLEPTPRDRDRGCAYTEQPRSGADPITCCEQLGQDPFIENAGVPEHYRRYLMGHAPARAAIASYTHLNRLREQFETALGREWPELLETIERRARALGLLLRE